MRGTCRRILARLCREQTRGFAQDLRPYVHFGARSNGRQWTKSKWLVGAGGVGALAYYQSLQEIPFTHRRHSIWLTPDMERAMGNQLFKQFKEEAMQTRSLLPEGHPATQLVKQIGMRLVQSTLEGKGSGFQDHMKDLDWEFIVIERQDPNAMVLPGGKVVVHTAILSMVKTQDELAAVLAHEIAHVLARHVAEKLSKEQLSELLRVLLFWCVGIFIPGALPELAVHLPNSRRIETEADIIGMQIAAQSCFDPSASVSVFEKLGRFERNSSLSAVPGFLRTHPVTDERLKFIRAALPEAEQTYESRGCSRYLSSYGRLGFLT